jgi:protein O-mannosyl-transferase
MSPDSALPNLPARRVLLGIVAAFTIVMIAVYGKSLSNGFVRWDDGLLIYENPGVMEMSPASLTRIFTTYDPELYIPITLLSYQIDYQIAGTNPFIFHLENFVWHLLNALLAAWLAYLLLRRQWAGLLVGLLFLLHPMHTESVAWASARKDVLSTFFFLGSLIGYLYYREREEKLPYRLSIAAFLLGLMSKGQILVLPFVLVMLDLYRGRGLSLQTLRDKVPYVILMVVFGIIGIIGKTGVAASSSTVAKILMSFKSTMFYLQKLVWPDHFSLLYPYTGTVTLFSPDFYVPVLIVTALAALCLILRRKLPELWLGLAFYYVVLAPTFLNFAKGTEMDMYFASDRYAYAASIGVFFVIASLLVRLTKLARESRSAVVGAGVVGAAIVLPLGIKAHSQSLVWKDTESLFQNVIEHFPESSHVAHNNLGNMHRLRKEMEKAIASYEKAIAIRPHAKTMSNLGGAYRQLKRYDDALRTYQEALKLSPGSKEAHFGLGIVYAELGRRAEAKMEYRKAIEIDPTYEEAYTNLGSLLLADRDVDGAIEEYRKALEVNAYFADAQYNLAVALSTKGDIDGAIEAYERAASLAPNTTAPLINLGILFAKKGDVQRSARAFRRVLHIDPNNKTALEALRQLGAN